MNTTIRKKATALLGVAATALVFGLGVAGAAPAQAADSLVACQESNLGAAESSIVISYPADCLPNMVTPGEGANDNAEYLPHGSALCYITFVSHSVTEVHGDALCGWALYFIQGDCEYIQNVFGTEFVGDRPAASSTCSGSSSSTRSASAIPAWVQAYGRSAGDDCLKGWGPSWQAWAVPVTGGWVCTRNVAALG